MEVETLDQRLQGITQGVCTLSLNQGPRTRSTAARLAQTESEHGGSCQTDSAQACMSENKFATTEHSGMHPHHKAMCTRCRSLQPFKI